MKTTFAIVWIIILSSMVNLFSVSQYPNTLMIPVRFYDFHSDLSNPEFQAVPVNSGGTWEGMVADSLDSQKKPVLGKNPYFNLGVAKWFQPWTKGDSSIPNYGSPPYPLTNAAGATPKTIKINRDTALKNIVINDTLAFVFIPGSEGIYTFKDTDFFPIDGKGFGNEGRSHNFSFTMELHREFTMKPGLVFQFAADDEAWVFINNKLVADLGGCHSSLSKTVLVESLGLTKEKKYSFDCFFCERHTDFSSVQITLSLVSVEFHPIYRIKTTAVPDSCIDGDSMAIAAYIYDDTGGVREDLGSQIAWKLIPGNPNSRNFLKAQKGSHNVFYARTAVYVCDTVIAEFIDPFEPLRVYRDTVIVSMCPRLPPPHCLVIESASNPSIDKNRAHAVDSIFFTSLDSVVSLIATLRDRYDNLVSVCSTSAWTSHDTSIVKVNAFTGTNGEVQIIPVQTNTQTSISARYVDSSGTFSDTVCVFIAAVTVSRNHSHRSLPPRCDIAIASLPGRPARIVIAANISIQRLFLIDVKGRIISSDDFPSQHGQCIFSLPPLAEGIYFVSLHTDHDVITRVLCIP